MLAMSHNVVRIALADDHVLLRKGIAEIINGFRGYEVCAEASNGRDLIDMMERDGELPDIAILDVNMPKFGGLETCQLIQEKFPEVRVIALSMYDDEKTIIQMLKAGANGYLLKDVHPAELEAALRQVMDKGHYYSELISSIMMNNLRDGGQDSKDTLNEREIQFLRLAATELTYKEIAQEMELSPRTIDGYRESLFEKLQAKSRVGLVLYAIKSGIVEV